MQWVIGLACCRLFFLTCFIIYPVMSGTTMQFFKCTPLNNNTRVLSADPSLDCDSELMWSWTWFAWFSVALYNVGIPALCFWVLFDHRHTLYTDPACALRFGLLFESYEERVWWFEMVQM